MARMVLFGPGYTGSRIADALEARGWGVTRVGRDASGVEAALQRATHILSSVPPSFSPERGGGPPQSGGGGGSLSGVTLEESPLHHPAATAALQPASRDDLPPAGHLFPLRPPPRSGEECDPVLSRYASAIARSGAWLGYLSSTGVYGDTSGGWVDESAPLLGRRPERNAADLAWLARGARVFRLPGIYGPGRSALDRVREGKAHRIHLASQVFSRIHVDDIVRAVLAAIERGPPGAYNIADDLPAPQNDLVAYACALLGLPVPPLQSLEEAGLSPAARAFYAENRRVANGKAARLLGWQPLQHDYRAGLRALMATMSPITTSTAPTTASTDQT